MTARLLWFRIMGCLCTSCVVIANNDLFAFLLADYNATKRKLLSKLWLTESKKKCRPQPQSGSSD